MSSCIRGATPGKRVQKRTGLRCVVAIKGLDRFRANFAVLG